MILEEGKLGPVPLEDLVQASVALKRVQDRCDPFEGDYYLLASALNLLLLMARSQHDEAGWTRVVVAAWGPDRVGDDPKQFFDKPRLIESEGAAQKGAANP